MITAVLVPAEESEPITIYEYEDGDISAIQRAVGGYFGTSDGVTDPLTFWYADDGKLVGLPINRRASLIWWMTDYRFFLYDCLAGDVLITGGADCDGKTQSCPDEFLNLLFHTDDYSYEITVNNRDTVRGKWRGSFFRGLERAGFVAQNNGAVTSFRVVPAS